MIEYTSSLEGNPFDMTRMPASRLENRELVQSLHAIAYELRQNTLAVQRGADERARHAEEQHNRNRLAAITAHKRGLTLPPDLLALATEGFEDTYDERSTR